MKQFGIFNYNTSKDLGPVDLTEFSKVHIPYFEEKIINMINTNYDAAVYIRNNYFLVRRGQYCGVIKLIQRTGIDTSKPSYWHSENGLYCSTKDNQFVVSDTIEVIGLNYINIIPQIEHSPIGGDVFCVQHYNGLWGAINARTGKMVTLFGQYDYMWGFDGRYCLVKKGKQTNFSGRGVIDISGKEVIGTDCYDNIHTFYGKGECIIVEKNGTTEYLSKYDLSKVCSDIQYDDCDPIVDVDISDAYDGDSDALWNTD